VTRSIAGEGRDLAAFLVVARMTTLLIHDLAWSSESISEAQSVFVTERAAARAAGAAVSAASFAAGAGAIGRSAVRGAADAASFVAAGSAAMTAADYIYRAVRRRTAKRAVVLRHGSGLGVAARAPRSGDGREHFAHGQVRRESESSSIVSASSHARGSTPATGKSATSHNVHRKPDCAPGCSEHQHSQGGVILAG
jgi:hypothetical protein